MQQAEYFYKSIPRIQLFFDSPNHCATFLGMVALILIGLTVTYWERRSKAIKYQFLFLMTGTLCLLSLLGLVMTYSRGGWIAFSLSTLLVTLFSPLKRRFALGFSILFFLFIFLLPKGSDRLNSVGDENDKSIKHRILVWKGAAAITADHWTSGVGGDQFGKEFKLWYQPLTLKTRYAAALNNFLTLSAERGIFALFFYLLLVTLPLWLVWRIVCENDNAWIQGVLAGQFLFCISGLFTYSLTLGDVVALYWILWTITFFYLLKKIWKKEFKITPLHFLPPTLFSSVICIGILLWGSIELRKIPTTQTRHSIDGKDYFLLSSRHLPSTATILFYPEIGTSLESAVLTFSRPLAAEGFSLLIAPYESAGKSALPEFQKINQWFLKNTPPPHLLIGHGTGARLGFITATHCEGFQSMILIAPETRWPFPELSPMNFIPTLTVPLLILHGLEDATVDPIESQRFQEALNQNHKQSQLLLLPQTTHSLDQDSFRRAIIQSIKNKTNR